ncbi:hypothetical protein SBADM41S_10335 [Streptomyces badius]
MPLRPENCRAIRYEYEKWWFPMPSEMPGEDKPPFEDSLGTEMRLRRRDLRAVRPGPPWWTAPWNTAGRTARRRRTAAVAGSVLTLALVGGGVTFATGQLGTFLATQ